jgi:SAM-dependent methyltransferase
MRVTYRHANNKEYWTRRWGDIPADVPMQNRSVYPLKYAEQTVTAKDGPILEAGCGAGRILRYYHENGYDITGIDFIEVAIEKLRAVDPTLKVETGDITQLQFADGRFPLLCWPTGSTTISNTGWTEAVSRNRCACCRAVRRDLCVVPRRQRPDPPDRPAGRQRRASQEWQGRWVRPSTR